MSEKPIRIVRGRHDRDNQYFVCARASAQDRELSWEARGVLWYLLSKADTWELRPKDLQQGCGRDKVYKILAELQAKRYVIREESRDDYGKFIEFVYKVYETPLPENAEMDNKPLPDLPDTDLPDTANTDIKELEKKTDLEKESDAPAPKPESTPLPPAIGLAIDHAVEQQQNPLINHTGAWMMADVFIRTFEGACKARNAPQHIPRTKGNKLIAAQWYDDGYTEVDIRRTVDMLFEAGKPVNFAFLQEKMSFNRAAEAKKVTSIDDGAVPDEWGVDSFMRQPARKVDAA